MIVVTGGSGMLGAHILYKLIEKNYTVKAFKRPQSNLSECQNIFSFYSPEGVELFKKINWVNCDINDPECITQELNPNDTFIHAAAMVSFNTKDKKQIYETNTEAVADIVNICLDKKVKQLCYISSIAALSKKNSNAKIDETIGEMNSDVSDYSKSKYLGEMEVWRGINEGLNAVILNPSVIIGPGNINSGSGKLFGKAMKGNKFYTDGGTGFVDVNDTADAVLKVIEKNILGERFVLNGDNISYRELFTLLAKYLNTNAPTMKAGKRLLQTASFFEKTISLIRGKSPQLTKQVIRSTQSFSQYDNNKAIRELNIKFKKPEKSIKQYAPYYLEKKKH